MRVRSMSWGGLGTETFICEAAADSASFAPDTITGFGYGIDKLDLSALCVISVSWTRVQNMFDSYEEVTIGTLDGPMKIRTNILNIASFGLSMPDFIFPDHGRAVLPAAIPMATVVTIC